MEAQGSKAKEYFNFPIQLVEGFLVNTEKVLDDIFNYALYAHAIKLDHNTDEAKMKAAFNDFEVESVVQNTLKGGRKLYNFFPLKSPFVGISKTIYFDFYKNEKTDFEKATLLAFLALKSIVGVKPYMRTNNSFMLSRMDGKLTSVIDYAYLSDEVRKYSTEYQTRKLRNELFDKWGLVYCQSRGFLASWSLTLDKLNEIAVFNSAKSKEKYRIKQMNEARKRAILRINQRLKP